MNCCTLSCVSLLRYMTRFLVILAIGFFALSLYDMYAMRAFMKNETSGQGGTTAHENWLFSEEGGR